MIEQALYNHLVSQASLCPYLAVYAGKHAIFNQKAPGDTDIGWEPGPQYGRIIFAVDMRGDPARAMGGTLAVDIMCCEENKYFPEDIEPLVRELIDGYFFCSGLFSVAAQWRNTTPFSDPEDKVSGCTITFDLLGFPVITTPIPDVIERINEWTSNRFENLHVINHDKLPECAWKPEEGESAVYWRLVTDAPAGWIPDTFQTIWRTATIRCHIFSEDNATAETVAREIYVGLYADMRLLRDGETPIMVNRRNTTDSNADPLRTGQLTVEATYAIIVYKPNDQMIEKITMSDNPNERRQLNGQYQESTGGDTGTDSTEGTE